MNRPNLEGSTPVDYIDRPSFVLSLALLTAISATTVDICLPAQPAIAASFGARPEAGGVIVSGYLLGYGPGQMIWGPLADRFGRIPTLMVGLFGFLGFTLACIGAGSLEVLALLRVAQGVFGGSGPVVARAVARDQGGGRRTARLLSTIAMIFGVAPMVAPLIGSVILLVADWRAQFWFLAVFTLVLMFSSHTFVRPATLEVRRDVVPTKLYWAASLGLFRQRDFLVGCGLLSTVFFGYATLLSSGAAMTVTQYDLAPEAFGPLFAVAAMAVILGPWLSRRLLVNSSPLKVLRVGALVTVFAGLCMGSMAIVEVSLPLLWAAIFVYIFGFGMIMPLASAIALEPAGKAAGIASSLLGAIPTLAGAGGAALAAGPFFPSAYQAICTIMAAAGLGSLVIAVFGIRIAPTRDH